MDKFILNELFLREAHSYKQLPKDLLDTMRNNKEFKGINNHQVNDIDKLNKRELEQFDSLIKEAIKTNEPEWENRLKKEKSFIKKQDLFCILVYRNGDSAWFSFRDKKVYDWGHEGNGFYPLSKSKSMWKPMPYRKWAQSIIDKKHIDSYKRI